MWTVYAPGTDDQPQYLARKWVRRAGGGGPTDQTMRAWTLTELREGIRAEGFDVCMARSPVDAPNIVEVWL